ncbi:MAG: hypothetical protein ACKVQT_30265 [Burkholderiales bacterium]
MKRNVLSVTAVAVLLGIASTGFASDADLELQPKRLEFGWFKRPVDTTSYVMPSSITYAGGQDYRFLTDYSPN